MSDTVSKLLNSAYFYLRFRPRSESEMQAYLEKKCKQRHLEPDQVAEAILDLKRQALIDDQAFIAWYVELRGTSKKKSVRLLRYELQKHGVSPRDVEGYFSEHDIDESQNASRALQGRWRSYHHLEAKKRFGRAASFLQRKGFSYSQIKTAIAELEEKR